jgi:hypothetical protein
VARFYGYFNFNRIFEKSSVLGPASVDEADPRYLTVLFFVEDGTVEIIEKKSVNSGIDGGLFFARRKTKKLEGGFLQLEDLAVGNVVSILGQEIHIYDADKFTRDYFRRELKLVLPPVSVTISDRVRVRVRTFSYCLSNLRYTKFLAKAYLSFSKCYLSLNTHSSLSRSFMYPRL